MSLICPVVDRTTTEQAERLNALFSVIVVTASFLTSPVLVALLGIEYYIRGFTKAQSPVTKASLMVLDLFRTEKKTVNAGPKVFAARLGFIMCCVITASFIFGAYQITLAASTLFILLAFMESALNFCVGCHIYTLLKKLGC